MAKRWYKSKTIWFNIGTSLVAAGNELLPILDVMSPEAAADHRALLIVAMSIGNLILRIVTSSPVKL